MAVQVLAPRLTCCIMLLCVVSVGCCSVCSLGLSFIYHVSQDSASSLAALRPISPVNIRPASPIDIRPASPVDMRLSPAPNLGVNALSHNFPNSQISISQFESNLQFFRE